MTVRYRRERTSFARATRRCGLVVAPDAWLARGGRAEVGQRTFVVVVEAELDHHAIVDLEHFYALPLIGRPLFFPRPGNS